MRETSRRRRRRRRVTPSGRLRCPPSSPPSRQLSLCKFPCILLISTVLPTDWPFSPPNIYFLTPNGRFRVNQKICLSISAHHPETWQPAWGIQHILQALISMLPTEGDGGIGSLNCTDEERQILATEVCVN